jgi:uncharacterized protein
LNSVQRFLAIGSLLIILATKAIAAVSSPYVLENTEVVTIPASHLNRSYELYVSFPEDYATSTKHYPVVYVTDAPYAFPLIRAIAGRVDRHGVGLEGFILVGLSYAKGESGVISRNRDYTPTERKRDLKSPIGVYGQSASYLDFLAKNVFPLVDSLYRSDPKRRIFVGHSYGSLLGLQALLERPNTFSHYILGSPSLWFDRGQPFDALRRYARTHADLKGKVRFFVGGLEQPNRNHPGEENMVALLNRYVSELRGHRWRGLDVKVTVLEGEDHATVFPRLVTQGLIWALPK